MTDFQTIHLNAITSRKGNHASQSEERALYALNRVRDLSIVKQTANIFQTRQSDAAAHSTNVSLHDAQGCHTYPHDAG